MQQINTLHQTLPLTTDQTEARRLRQEFQVAQAADNATLRNAMATADQTQINTITQARELYTNSVEDERHSATVDRANTVCWCIASLCFRSNTYPIRSKIPLLRKRFHYV